MQNLTPERTASDGPADTDGGGALETGAQGGEPAEGEVRWLDAQEQTAWRSYLTTNHLLLDSLDRALQPHGTNLSEYEILAILSESDRGRMRMSVLADTVVQSRSRLTHTASRMERRGWVSRRPVPHDGRGVELCLTREGRCVLERLAPIHVESVRRCLIDALGRDDLIALGTMMSRVRIALPGTNGTDGPDGEH